MSIAFKTDYKQTVSAVSRWSTTAPVISLPRKVTVMVTETVKVCIISWMCKRKNVLLIGLYHPNEPI